MDFLTVLSNPFLWGLALGLAIALFVSVNGWFSRQSLKKENASLIRSHALINNEGYVKLRNELEELRTQNENLRIRVAKLNLKPGNADRRMLLVYDKAISLMNARAPGFAPVWEAALCETETEMKMVDDGNKYGWLGKIIRTDRHKSSLTTESQLDQGIPIVDTKNNHRRKI